jgi:hypothetical protein
VLPHAPPGSYKIRTNYFGSHQDSKTTGSTSCVIWSVKHLGDFEREEAVFTSVRLEDFKGQASCFSLDVGLASTSVKFTDTDGDVIEFRRVAQLAVLGVAGGPPASAAAAHRIEELVNGKVEIASVATIVSTRLPFLSVCCRLGSFLCLRLLSWSFARAPVCV